MVIETPYGLSAPSTGGNADDPIGLVGLPAGRVTAVFRATNQPYPNDNPFEYEKTITFNLDEGESRTENVDF